MVDYCVAIYSKFKTKKSIKDAMQDEEFRKNPSIDLQCPMTGRYGTPEEIRQYSGEKKFTITNHPKRTWFGQFIWDDDEEEWKFK